MLVCKKCGANNQLGRVFCADCGGKLDLSDLDRDAIFESQRVPFLVKHWQKIATAVALVPVIMVGLAFWPKNAPLGEKGNTIGAGKVTRQITALLSITTGRRLTIDMAEKDINGYLEYRKIRRTDVQMCSVRLMRGSFGARLSRKLGSFPIGPIRVEPTLSSDLRCYPVGNQLLVRSASIGHLRVFGPLKRIAAGPFIKLLGGDKELKLLKAVSEIDIKDGVVSLSVAP